MNNKQQKLEKARVIKNVSMALMVMGGVPIAALLLYALIFALGNIAYAIYAPILIGIILEQYHLFWAGGLCLAALIVGLIMKVMADKKIKQLSA